MSESFLDVFFHEKCSLKQTLDMENFVQVKSSEKLYRTRNRTCKLEKLGNNRWFYNCPSTGKLNNSRFLYSDFVIFASLLIYLLWRHTAVPGIN